MHRDEEFIVIKRSLGIYMNNDDIIYKYLTRKREKPFAVQS